MLKNCIQIDGSFLEGGGQILRNSASLSCLLDCAIKVDKIRAGRSNPGLRPQHLSGLELLQDLTRGRLEDAHVGSTAVSFKPGPIQSGSFLADTKTAGSVCLLIQAALPCTCFAPDETQILLRGGTNADMAPQIDYFDRILKPALVPFGIDFQCSINRRGYFPKGGGEVILKTTPVTKLKPVQLLERGEIVNITGRSFVAGTLPKKLAHVMAEVAEDRLRRQHVGVPVAIEAVQEPQSHAVGNGFGIILVAETSTKCKLAGSALGKKGVQAEAVGCEAANELLKNLAHGGCVDQHLQDQLIIFMALADGKSRVKCGPLTEHTKTAIHVVEQMSEARFNMQQVDEESIIIECDGIGLQNRARSS